MHRRRVFTSAVELLIVLLIAMALPDSAKAQPEPRDFGVFADWQGQESSLEAEAFVPFNVYVVGFQLDGEVKGFEFSLHFPDEFFVLAITMPAISVLHLYRS